MYTSCPKLGDINQPVVTVSYLLFALIFGPYLNNTHGMGNKAIATKPNKLLAHPMPSFSYTISS